MTVRRKTMVEEVEDLKVIITNRKSRVVWLTSLLESGVTTANDRKWIAKEIAEHEKWIGDTEKVIRKFYSPAQVA